MAPDTSCLADVLLQQAPACHWLIDAAGVFAKVYGNPAPLFGKAAAQLTGRPYATALGSDLAASWGGRFQRALAGETVVLRERLGENAWSIFLFPVRLEGEIRFAGGSAREVTSWASAEQELRYTVLGALRAQEHERSAASKFLHDTVGQN